nr:hypothetical protein [Tanacetum cinerariifolium]
MSYLTDYEEINEGYVAFGGNLKGGKSQGESSQNDGFQLSSVDGKKVDEDPRQESECKDPEKEDNVNNTNNVNAAGTNGVNIVGANTNNELPFDLEIPALEDISTFNFLSDHEDDVEEADMNNMDTTIQEVWTLVDLPYKKELLALNGSSGTRRMKEMDVKSAFLYGKINEEVYVVDIIFGLTKKELCNAFENMMHEKFQISSIGELTFFLGLQVKQKQDGIFISQDKYVAEILKKYGFSDVKNASTPMETQKPLLKDKDGQEVDVHVYRSMIGSLLYLASSRPDLMFAVCPCVRYQPTESEGFEQIVNFLNANPIKYVLMVNPTVYTLCIEQFWATVTAKTINGEGKLQALVDGKKIIITDSTIRRDVNWKMLKELIVYLMLLSLNNLHSWEMSHHNRIYVTPSHIKKIFRNMKRVGKGFSRRDTPLFPTMMVQAQEDMGEGSANPTDPYHTLTIIPPSTSQPQRLRKSKRKDTELPQTSVPTSVADEAVNEEMNDSLERGATTVSSLDIEQDRGNISKTQSKATPNEPSSQGTSSGGDPRRKRSRTHRLKRLYKVGLSTRVESFTNEGLGEEDASKQRRIANIDANKDITLVSTYDEQMFDVDQYLGGEEVFVAQQNKDVVEKEVDVAQIQVTTAATTPTILINEANLAQPLAELKYAKPKSKAKGIVFHEPEESITTTAAIPKSKSQDNGKSKMIEEHVKLDEKVALKLHAEL